MGPVVTFNGMKEVMVDCDQLGGYRRGALFTPERHFRCIKEEDATPEVQCDRKDARYAGMTVKQLKDALQSRNLSKSGRKADLVARLSMDDIVSADPIEVWDSLVDSQGHDDPQLLVQKLGQKSVDSEQAGQTTVDSNAAAQLDDSPNSFAGLMGVDSKVADESPLGFCVDPNAETQAMNPIEFNSQLDRNWYTELNQNYES